MTQYALIIKYLEDVRDWVFEYKIHGLPTPYGFIGARGDRNVRQLIKDGKVDSRMEGKYRQVRFKKKIKLEIEHGNYNISYQIPINRQLKLLGTIYKATLDCK